MDTILWTQNESPLIPSTLIIDGVRSEFEGSKIQKDAMKILSSVSGWKRICFENSHLVVKFKGNEGFVISSCFIDKDEAGRPMTFSYYSNSTDFDNVVVGLRNDLSKLNRNYDWNELNQECYNKVFSEIGNSEKKDLARKVGLGVLVVSLIAFLTFGTKGCSDNNTQPTDTNRDSTDQTNGKNNQFTGAKCDYTEKNK